VFVCEALFYVSLLGKQTQGKTILHTPLWYFETIKALAEIDLTTSVVSILGITIALGTYVISRLRIPTLKHTAVKFINSNGQCLQ
jgi:hypothetical protein